MVYETVNSLVGIKLSSSPSSTHSRWLAERAKWQTENENIKLGT